MTALPLVLADETPAILTGAALVGGVLIALVSIILRGVHRMVHTFQRERTRREIAAYVAEGSIPPEEGERLMRAAGTDGDAKGKCC